MKKMHKEFPDLGRSVCGLPLNRSSYTDTFVFRENIGKPIMYELFRYWPPCKKCFTPLEILAATNL